MSQLHVSLFGKFCAQYRQQTLEGFEANKVQELFCYLLLHRQQTHHREKLAALLWQENSTHQSKRYLSKVLWQLQTAFDEYDQSIVSQLLWVDSDWIRLNVEADLWLDVAIFEKAYALIRCLTEPALFRESAPLLEQAVNLYTGDLLEGWYQDWCIFERERFQYMFLGMLDSLMGYSEAQQDYETAVTYGIEILRHDQAREHTHRSLMRLYYLAGNRSEALRQYERCAELLDKELSVQPANSTIALYHQIKDDHLSELPSPTPPTAIAAPTLTPNLAKTLNQLKHLQITLCYLQEQTQQEIERVESVINAPT